MKRTIVAGGLFLLTLLSVNAIAQSNGDYNERIAFGLKLGINSANVYDTKGNGFVADPKIGLAAGGFIAIPIGEYLGLQPEVLFSQKGYKSEGKILLQNYSFKHTSNNLDIPIQLQVKLAPFITLLAGPQFSYLLSTKNELDINGNTAVDENQFENDNVRKNKLGFTGGLDVNINRFVIGGRAGWDIQDNKGDGTSSNPRYKNRWIQLTAGVRF